MASGPEVPKPDKANHPGRQVSSSRWGNDPTGFHQRLLDQGNSPEYADAWLQQYHPQG